MSSYMPKQGDLVWARMKGFPDWPGQVVDSSDVPSGLPKLPGRLPANSMYPVVFFGQGDYAWVKNADIKPFICDEAVAAIKVRRIRQSVEALIEFCEKTEKQVGRSYKRELQWAKRNLPSESGNVHNKPIEGLKNTAVQQEKSPKASGSEKSPGGIKAEDKNTRGVVVSTSPAASTRRSVTASVTGNGKRLARGSSPTVPAGSESEQSPSRRPVKVAVNPSMPPSRETVKRVASARSPAAEERTSTPTSCDASSSSSVVPVKKAKITKPDRRPTAASERRPDLPVAQDVLKDISSSENEPKIEAKPDTTQVAAPSVVDLTNPKEAPRNGPTFGFIGLGIMGSRMAKRLIEVGFAVTLYSRSHAPDDYRPFLELGHFQNVTIGANPADVLSKVDVVFTAISDSDSYRELVFAKNTGFLETNGGNLDGKSIVNLSTIEITLSLEVDDMVRAKHGEYLEASMEGSAQNAENGTLLLLCSGSRAVYEKCSTAFRCLSSRAMYLGEAANSLRLKLCLQGLRGTLVGATAETFALAESLGVSQSDLADIIQLTNLNSVLLKDLTKRIVDSRFDKSFQLGHMQDDLQEVNNLAHLTMSPMFITSAANEVYRLARSRGDEGRDMAAVYRSIAGPSLANQ